MLGVCLKFTQHNYGSKLQALATVTMFEKLGLDYEILRYNKHNLKFIASAVPRLLNVVFLNDRYNEIQKKIEMKKHPEIKALVDEREKCFDELDDIFLAHESILFNGHDDLTQQSKTKYDKFVTCSDQLWSPSALGSNFYNLVFAPDDKLKLSWASSFGVSKIPWYQVRRTRNYLNRIEHISVREDQGQKIVKDLTGKDVPVMLDPVFAFTKEEWDNMVPVEENEFGEDYIFCYFLGANEEHRKIANKLAKETGLKIVTIKHLDRYCACDESFGDFAPYDVGPKRFLNILRNAKYVCTDSFHGTAFSVIYEKQFLVFNRYLDTSSNSKNSRISSVCNILGLEDRRVTSNDINISNIEKEIDYKLVKEKISPYIKATYDYLSVLK